MIDFEIVFLFQKLKEIKVMLNMNKGKLTGKTFISEIMNKVKNQGKENSEKDSKMSEYFGL